MSHIISKFKHLYVFKNSNFIYSWNLSNIMVMYKNSTSKRVSLVSKKWSEQESSKNWRRKADRMLGEVISLDL